MSWRPTAPFGPLSDQAPLEVCDGAKHVKVQLTGRRGGVDLCLQADQADTALFQHGYGAEEPGEEPAQAIKADDRQRIAVARVGEQSVQPRPLRGPAGAHVGEDFESAGLGQPKGLPGEVLIAGGDARVTENGAHAVPQPIFSGPTGGVLSEPRFRPQNTSSK